MRLWVLPYLATLSVFPCVDVHAQTVIYQSWGQAGGWELITEPGEAGSDQELPNGGETTAQVADDLTLAGTDRFISQFEVRIGRSTFLSPPPTAVTHLYLYAPGDGGLPGQLLWQGASAPVLVPSSILQAPVLSFAPNILVPDTFFFAVGFSQISGTPSALGPTLQTTGPTIGATSPSVFYLDSLTGAWSVAPPAPFNTYLQARVTAVPAPAGALLLPAGLAAARRRRRG